MTDVSTHSEACQWDLFVPQTTIKHMAIYQQQAGPIWPTALSRWCILPHRFHSAWTWTAVTTSWHLPHPQIAIIYLLITALNNPCLPCTLTVITTTLDSHLYHHHLVWPHPPIHPCCLQLGNHSHLNNSNSNSQDITPCLPAHLDLCLDTMLAVTVLTWCPHIWQQRPISAADHLPPFTHTWSLKSISMTNVWKIAMA